MQTEEEKIVQFLRKKDYTQKQVLGQGACGKTVLLRDEILGADFVCKKYSPHNESLRSELFANFLREIKLMHEILHHNIVRVFNYYLYPEQFTGYILMEYVQGLDIEDFLRVNPEQSNEVFLQTIEGFCHLEGKNILHRDIRPLNILVRNDGVVKIIDLGFGKRVEQSVDFDKSITLNWWCDPPKEFSASKYDFSTEVYFVGKLFEKLLQDFKIEHFKYGNVLRRMCSWEPTSRVSSFFDVRKEVTSDLFYEIEFAEDELKAYRQFADAISEHVSKIEHRTKYVEDIEKVKAHLDTVYRSCMLEDEAADCAPILRCFFDGTYYYSKRGFPIHMVRDFLRLLKGCGAEKQKLILANLHTRLDAIPRYSPPAKSKFDDMDDDIPF